jgi:hypothetical protein
MSWQGTQKLFQEQIPSRETVCLDSHLLQLLFIQTSQHPAIKEILQTPRKDSESLFIVLSEKPESLTEKA